MARIFISYCREDQAFASRLVSDLKKLGVNTWLDVEDIPAGVNWSTAVQQGLDSCQMMIVILSPDSASSQNVEQEWQAYLDDNKPVIPLLWKPARVHFQLRRIQYVDFSSQGYEAAFPRLAAELQRLGVALSADPAQVVAAQTQDAESQPDKSSGAEPRGELYAALLAFFQEDGWPYSELDAAPIMRMGFSGTNGKWQCYARAREEQKQFVFYSVLDLNTPEDKRLSVADFLTRANYGLIMGNFELDFRDGEIRFKTSIDVEGEHLTSPLIRNMVYANVMLMDRYLPGIMAVIYGDVSPENAIAKVEG